MWITIITIITMITDRGPDLFGARVRYYCMMLLYLVARIRNIRTVRRLGTRGGQGSVWPSPQYHND